MSQQELPLAIRRHQLVSTVRDLIDHQNVVVGVSGGVDSIALLLLCLAASMQQSSTFTVTVGHIHHGLRTESDNEQVFVEKLCERLNVPCVTKRIVVKPKNGSLAAGAREARYESLSEISKASNAAAVLVAHHAEDQLETMLMALCRGGGLRKIAGMASSRSLSGGLTLLRPVLHADKQTLIDICKSAGVQWCDDPTNSDCSTPRGRLRKDVIPVLRELWTAADRHAANASSMLHVATDAFESSVPRGNSWSRESLCQLPIPVIAAAMHQAVGQHATYETIHSIASAVVDSNTNPRTFVCSDGCVATVTAYQVEVVYT